MPPKPMLAMPRVNSTCWFASADSSRNGLASGSRGTNGTNSRTISAVARAMPPTAANATGQPNWLPAQVPSGAPSKIATVRPIITRATARAR